MINWETDLGRRALTRIASEDVFWLTTLAPGGFPQPRPVWFVWEAGSFLIYSTAQARKVAHIQAHPSVALHFNTDAEGGDIQVFLGQARLDPTAPAADVHPGYSAKYRAGIQGLGLTEARYAALFSVAIRVVPERLRGLEPIPGL
ncbi:MAG: TIGR03667 family PPOX class F420-dependent oxidoreductase [Anaerolineales bacterium]|nr:TIGR03667 family PPOX class F420-dependent oxidoreductase [Anaerolineales bacterium]